MQPEMDQPYNAPHNRVGQVDLLVKAQPAISTNQTGSLKVTEKKPVASTPMLPRVLGVTELIEEFDRFATNHPELCSKRNLDGPWVVRGHKHVQYSFDR